MNRKHYLIILLLIFSSIFFLFMHQLTETQYSPTSDEGYYYRYAKVVSEKGTKGFQELIKWYASSEETLKHPAPIRIGHILPIALWFKLFSPSFTVLGEYSFFCFILFLISTFYFCRKYFNLDTAFLCTLLLSSSPLMMAMSRRALSDSAVNLTWGLTVWLFLGLLIQRKKTAYILFLVSFTLAILIKESSIMLLPFFVVAMIVYVPINRQTLSPSYMAGLIGLPMVLAGIIYFITFGGIDNCITAMRAICSTHFNPHHSNSYAMYYSAGPWYRYIVDFMMLTPMTTLIFIGYFFYVLFARKFEWKILYFWMYFAIVFGILSSLSHTKVVRFAINLEMVMSLFTVLGLYEIFKHQNLAVQNRRVLLTCIFIFFINFINFLQTFYLTGLLDPISYHLFVIHKFIPAY